MPILYSEHILRNPESMGFLFAAGLIALMMWSLVWKAFALWHSARRSERVWFIIFLFVNTVGILEMIYLFWFVKRDKTTKNT